VKRKTENLTTNLHVLTKTEEESAVLTFEIVRHYEQNGTTVSDLKSLLMMSL